MTSEPLLAGYPATTADEVVDPDGGLRAGAEPLRGLLRRPDLTDLAAVADRAFRRSRGPDLVRRDGRPVERPVVLDPLPRLLPAADWALLAAGVAQRHRALQAFLADTYRAAGRRRGDPDRAPSVVRAGVLPEWAVLSHPSREPGAVGLARPGQPRVALFACDVLRTSDGSWLVRADDVGSAAGLGTAFAARAALSSTARSAGQAADPAEAVALLRAALATAGAGADDGPRVALLVGGDVEGPAGEDAVLADALGVPLVTAGDLWPRSDGGLAAILGGRRRPVDVLWLRVDAGDLAGLPTPMGRPLAPLLAEAVRVGRLGLVNVPGGGLADDPATFAVVPELVRFYLGEEPLLGQVPTWVLADDAQRAAVHDRLHELELVPLAGYGGGRRVLGPACGPDELSALHAELGAAPHRFVARAPVEPTTAPFLTRGRLAPRAVDLRLFSVDLGEGGVRALPVPLSRAVPDELLTGGQPVEPLVVKDTWVLTG